MEKQTMVEDTIGEQVMTSIKGQDEELEKKHPVAPFALVFGVYPVVLLVIALLASLYFFASSETKKEVDVDPNISTQVEQPK